jgi:hypothetical protein
MNNKGFAITATIFGFLILFLMVLLAVLTTLRSENNRSLTISERIDDNTFLYKEIIYQENIRLTDGGSLSGYPRGKYYLNFRYSSDVSNVVNNNCYIYVPQKAKISLTEGILKINDNSATILGNNCSNNGITEVLIVKSFIAGTAD